MMNFLLTLLLPIYLVFHFVGPIPIDHGVHEGQLNPCLNSRHCAEKSWNSNNPSIDYAKLVAFINEKPRTIVVQETNYYLHAEASSAFFGFVDDLEIYANTESKIMSKVDVQTDPKEPQSATNCWYFLQFIMDIQKQTILVFSFKIYE